MKKAKSSKSSKEKKTKKPYWGSIVSKKLVINAADPNSFNTLNVYALIPPADSPAYSGDPSQTFRD